VAGAKTVKNREPSRCHSHLWVRVFRAGSRWLGHLDTRGEAVKVRVDSFTDKEFQGASRAKLPAPAEFTPPANVQTVDDRIKQVFGL